MNKKILETIKIIIVVAISALLVCSLIVSQNEYHLITCTDEHCIVCNIIHFAQNIISISVIVVILYAFLNFLIYLFLSRLREKQSVLIQLSLVSQKVQLNE